MNARVRLAVGLALALALAAIVSLSAIPMPGSAPAQASGSCQQWTVPGNGPAWMRQKDNGQCADPVNDARVKRCVVGIFGSMLVGSIGFPLGTIGGALGGALGCGSQWIN